MTHWLTPKTIPFSNAFLSVSEQRHLILGKIRGWHIFCSGKRRIISLSVQDKEGVETSALKPVGSGSREEAVLHGIPSHGHKCRGVAPQGRK